jgi:hypothetical protein
MIDSVLFKKNSDCDDAAHAAVIGFPGMGKSLLVSQALLHSQQLQCDSLRNVFIMKLRGRGAVSVTEDIIMHSRSLGSRIGVSEASSAQELLENMKKYLSHVRFIAVIDDANSDGLQAAAKWIPRSKCRYCILLTSQQPASELGDIEAHHGKFRVLELNAFDDAASVALLVRMCSACGHLQEQSLRLLNAARFMGHLPLAIRLFGDWMRLRYVHCVKSLKDTRANFLSVSAAQATVSGEVFDAEAANRQFDAENIFEPILCAWEAHASIPSEVTSSSDRHVRGLVGTVCLSLQELQYISGHHFESCCKLIYILSFCRPSIAPWSLFLGHRGNSIPALESITTRESLQIIAGFLHRSGLVNIQCDNFVMHQLLQRVFRMQVPGQISDIVSIIDGRIGDEDVAAAAAYREYLPAAFHAVEEVMSVAEEQREWCVRMHCKIADLMCWLGGGELEVQIRTKLLKLDTAEPSTNSASLMTSLASALCRSGKHHEALPFLATSLEIRRRLLPPDHPHIGCAISSLAAVHLQLGKLDDAVRLEEDALEYRRRVLPPDHPDIYDSA